jgi:ribosomal protein S21
MIIVRNTDDIERVIFLLRRISQPILKELKHKTYFESRTEKKKRKHREHLQRVRKQMNRSEKRQEERGRERRRAASR